jgi:hypothetical protein
MKIVQDDRLLATAAQALFQSFQSRVTAFTIALGGGVKPAGWPFRKVALDRVNRFPAAEMHIGGFPADFMAWCTRSVSPHTLLWA